MLLIYFDMFNNETIRNQNSGNQYIIVSTRDKQFHSQMGSTAVLLNWYIKYAYTLKYHRSLPIFNHHIIDRILNCLTQWTFKKYSFITISLLGHLVSYDILNKWSFFTAPLQKLQIPYQTGVGVITAVCIE